MQASANLPTKQSLLTMPLSDLIKERRGLRKDGALANFAHTFAMHPSVKALHPMDSGLTRDELAQRWTTLRWEAGGGGKANRQLTEAVKYHLEKVVKADEETCNMIDGHWLDFRTKQKALNCCRRRAEASPEAKNKQRAYKRDYAARLSQRGFISGYGPSLQDLIESYDENLTGLSALNIEQKTRRFHHLQRPRHEAKKQLRDLLEHMGSDEERVKAANGARIAWLEKDWQSAARLRRKESGRTEAKLAQEMELDDEQANRALIRLSRWWIQG